MYQVTANVELQIANMQLDEAYFWAAKVNSIYHTSEKPLVEAAVVIVKRHEEKVREQVKALEPVLDEIAWSKLPWYKKIIPIFLGLIDLVIYGATETVFWRVKRWHVVAFLVVLGLVFFGGRGVSNFFKNRAIANANPLATEVVLEPAAVLGVAPQASPVDSQANPATALSQPLSVVVDCTAATCPDAVMYIANYPFPDDPDGSATLRSLDGTTILGQIPKGTSVWIITSSVGTGKFCAKMPGTATEECRRGQIKPIAALPFTYNGGWVSFTALQPVSP